MRKLTVEELERLSVEEFKDKKKLPVVVVLDNIRSMHNVGAAFRTSDAFLVEKVYLCGITARPPHREINKTALGATESVQWEYVEDVNELVETLREDYKIVCVEQADESVALEDFMPYPSGRYCLVFGNEVYGVNERLVEESDACVEITQFGTKHSLNVSVCIGIVVWEFFKKLRP